MFEVSMVSCPDNVSSLIIDYVTFYHLYVSDDGIDIIDRDSRIEVLNFDFKYIRAYGKGDDVGCYRIIVGRKYKHGEGEYVFQFPDNTIRRAFHRMLQEEIEKKAKAQSVEYVNENSIMTSGALYQNVPPRPKSHYSLRKLGHERNDNNEGTLETEDRYYDVTVISSNKAKELNLSFAETFRIQVNGHLLKLYKHDLTTCLYYWPLHYIRSYKLNKDWNCFILHAGRRCMSGEGELCIQFLVDGEAELFFKDFSSKTERCVKRLSRGTQHRR